MQAFYFFESLQFYNKLSLNSKKLSESFFRVGQFEMWQNTNKVDFFCQS
jgi:hypothetical protein